MLLTKVLEELGFTKYYYTNLVLCRSCEPAVDQQTNEVRLNRMGLPILRDVPPIPTHIAACQERLHNEIYLVDPFIIVSLGGTATEALMGKAISITQIRGKAHTIEIPGRGWLPSLTETRKVWGRKLHGKLEYPLKRNMVRYTLIPTVHPGLVVKNLSNMDVRSPYWYFCKDIKLAISTYNTFNKEGCIDNDK
jgi:hypothetical protein